MKGWAKGVKGEGEKRQGSKTPNPEKLWEETKRGMINGRRLFSAKRRRSRSVLLQRHD